MSGQQGHALARPVRELVPEPLPPRSPFKEISHPNISWTEDLDHALVMFVRKNNFNFSEAATDLRHYITHVSREDLQVDPQLFTPDVCRVHFSFLDYKEHERQVKIAQEVLGSSAMANARQGSPEEEISTPAQGNSCVPGSSETSDQENSPVESVDQAEESRAPSDFNIFQHSLKKDIANIHDAVRTSLPSAVDSSDESDNDSDSEGSVDIVFSGIDHSKSDPAAMLDSGTARDQNKKPPAPTQIAPKQEVPPSPPRENAAMPAPASSISASPRVPRKRVVHYEPEEGFGMGGDGYSEDPSLGVQGCLDAAASAFAEGRAHDAVSEVTAYLTLNNGDQAIKYKEAIELRSRAHFAAHNFLEADDELTVRLGMGGGKELADFWSLRGMCRRALGQYESAAGDFEKALELDENHSEAFHEYRRLRRMLTDEKIRKSHIPDMGTHAAHHAPVDAAVEAEFWKEVQSKEAPSRASSSAMQAMLDLSLGGIDLDQLLVSVQENQEGSSAEPRLDAQGRSKVMQAVQQAMKPLSEEVEAEADELLRKWGSNPGDFINGQADSDSSDDENFTASALMSSTFLHSKPADADEQQGSPLRTTIAGKLRDLRSNTSHEGVSKPLFAESHDEAKIQPPSTLAGQDAKKSDSKLQQASRKSRFELAESESSDSEEEDDWMSQRSKIKSRANTHGSSDAIPRPQPVAMSKAAITDQEVATAVSVEDQDDHIDDAKIVADVMQEVREREREEAALAEKQAMEEAKHKRELELRRERALEAQRLRAEEDERIEEARRHAEAERKRRAEQEDAWLKKQEEDRARAEQEEASRLRQEREWDDAVSKAGQNHTSTTAPDVWPAVCAAACAGHSSLPPWAHSQLSSLAVAAVPLPDDPVIAASVLSWAFSTSRLEFERGCTDSSDGVTVVGCLSATVPDHIVPDSFRSPILKKQCILLLLRSENGDPARAAEMSLSFAKLSSISSVLSPSRPSGEGSWYQVSRAAREKVENHTLADLAHVIPALAGENAQNGFHPSAWFALPMSDSINESDAGRGCITVCIKPHALLIPGFVSSFLAGASHAPLHVVAARIACVDENQHNSLMADGCAFCPPASQAMVVLSFAGEDAVSVMETVLGPDDPVVAQRTDPCSLRAQFGESKELNLAVFSHSAERRLKDLHQWFTGPTVPLRSDSLLPVRPSENFSHAPSIPSVRIPALQALFGTVDMDAPAWMITKALGHMATKGCKLVAGNAIDDGERTVFCCKWEGRALSHSLPYFMRSCDLGAATPPKFICLSDDCDELDFTEIDLEVSAPGLQSLQQNEVLSSPKSEKTRPWLVPQRSIIMIPFKEQIGSLSNLLSKLFGSSEADVAVPDAEEHPVFASSPSGNNTCSLLGFTVLPKMDTALAKEICSPSVKGFECFVEYPTVALVIEGCGLYDWLKDVLHGNAKGSPARFAHYGGTSMTRAALTETQYCQWAASIFGNPCQFVGLQCSLGWWTECFPPQEPSVLPQTNSIAVSVLCGDAALNKSVVTKVLKYVYREDFVLSGLKLTRLDPSCQDILKQSAKSHGCADVAKLQLDKPVFALLLSRSCALQMWQNIAGPEDFDLANEHNAFCLNAVFGSARGGASVVTAGSSEATQQLANRIFGLTSSDSEPATVKADLMRCQISDHWVLPRPVQPLASKIANNASFKFSSKSALREAVCTTIFGGTLQSTSCTSVLEGMVREGFSLVALKLVTLEESAKKEFTRMLLLPAEHNGAVLVAIWERDNAVSRMNALIGGRLGMPPSHGSLRQIHGDGISSSSTRQNGAAVASMVFSGNAQVELFSSGSLSMK